MINYNVSVSNVRWGYNYLLKCNSVMTINSYMVNLPMWLIISVNIVVATNSI